MYDKKKLSEEPYSSFLRNKNEVVHQLSNLPIFIKGMVSLVGYRLTYRFDFRNSLYRIEINRFKDRVHGDYCVFLTAILLGKLRNQVLPYFHLSDKKY